MSFSTKYKFFIGGLFFNAWTNGEWCMSCHKSIWERHHNFLEPTADGLPGAKANVAYGARTENGEIVVVQRATSNGNFSTSYNLQGC